MSTIIPLPCPSSARLVEDVPDPADSVAARLVVPAEWRKAVARRPLERAVNLSAAGPLDEPPDVRRPDAAGRQDGDAAASGVDQPREVFVIGGVGHHPPDTQIDELLEGRERVGDDVEGTVEDDAGVGNRLSRGTSISDAGVRTPRATSPSIHSRSRSMTDSSASL
jgi:hypothetical protein